MNDTLQIQLPESTPAYEPGDDLLGTVSWNHTKPVKKIELHLFWYTLGVGDHDSRVVETLQWEELPAQGERHFEIRLPRAPYSLSADNLSIHWVLEANLRPGRHSARRELTIAPERAELKLNVIQAPPSQLLKKIQGWFG